MDIGVQRQAAATLAPERDPVTYNAGGCVGPRAGPDVYGKSRPHRDSIARPFNP